MKGMALLLYVYVSLFLVIYVNAAKNSKKTIEKLKFCY